MSEKLVSYIKKGIKQGFNTEYIKKVLQKHGYSEAEIETAIAKATGQPFHKRKPSTFLLGVLAVAAVLLLFAFAGLLQSEAESTALERQVAEQERAVQQYLDRVAGLSERIDAQEKTIEQQLKELRKKDYTVEQKEKALRDMESLYERMKEERREVRNLLVELLKEVVVRFEKKGTSGGAVNLQGDLTREQSAPDAHTTN